MPVILEEDRLWRVVKAVSQVDRCNYIMIIRLNIGAGGRINAFKLDITPSAAFLPN